MFFKKKKEKEMKEKEKETLLKRFKKSLEERDTIIKSGDGVLLHDFLKEVKNDFNIDYKIEHVECTVGVYKVEITYKNLEDIKYITDKRYEQKLQNTLNDIRQKICLAADKGKSMTRVVILDDLFDEISNTLEKEGYEIKISDTDDIMSEYEIEIIILW